jgi:hypothetical protein
MEDIWVGIGFLILVSVGGLIVTFVQLFKRLKSLEGKDKTLKHLEEHVIKMSELVIQNNEFIASRLRTIENKGILSRDDIDKIKEYLGMKK